MANDTYELLINTHCLSQIVNSYASFFFLQKTRLPIANDFKQCVFGGQASCVVFVEKKITVSNFLKFKKVSKELFITRCVHLLADQIIQK